MAKNKKKGFFSWLGFGQKEQEQPQQDVEQQAADAEQTAVAPVAEEVVEHIAEPEAEATAHSHEEVEAFADDVVEVTEEVAESEKPQPVEPVIEVIEEAAPQAEAVPEVVEEAQPEAEPVAEIEHETLPLAEEIVEEEPAAVIEEEVAVAHIEAAQEEIAEDELTDEELEAQALASVDEAEEVAEEPAEEVVVQEQEKPTKEGFFARLKRSLLKTKENLGSGFISLFRGKKIDDDLFEELEEQLLIADVGVETTRKIIASLTEGASRKQLRDAEALYGLLKDEMGDILAKVDEPLNIEGKTPFVILMVGVNGVGKTTTIGKLARQFEQQGKSVMLAAGDTFRAAAVEQLQVWGQRNDIPVIAQHTGADSASVIFDAIQAAKARNVDVLIADTAGRLQNKSHLMEELKKIVRVMKKLDESAPHEIMLTIDASTGQNAISQAKLFHEAVGLTGITLTKLDGTAKGGVIFSVADQFGIPIRYIGVGERIEDLRPFKSDDFIEALFARED
ncbi:signal recognition particle-docking protein FtsY [Enterobacter sp. CC120223-11]|uniref:signal recognition particle-docking protein FtsY n=1 Tax=Enterobacter sp. CC120223-11 TaxID=1378073 RepID=UPI000BCD1B0B|nr:signal recognition particle-docking protein FtsY [Enterobacter sp. CC120223-11]SNY71530.1 signal recognition particle-docking protein FtsY [Enterobacter sp. CC120223-11]